MDSTIPVVCNSYEVVRMDAQTPNIQVVTFITCLGPEVVEIFKSSALTSMEAIDINVIHKRFTQHCSQRFNETYDHMSDFNSIRLHKNLVNVMERVILKQCVKQNELKRRFWRRDIREEDGVCSYGSMNDWYEKVTINGEQFVFKLDTGAQCNLLPLIQARRLRLTVSVTKSANVISFNGERTKIDGETNARCLIKDHESRLLYKMADLDFVPILGKNTSEKKRLQKQTSKLRFKMHFLNCSTDWGAWKAINTPLIW
jgi:hypothetical protein